MYNLTLTLPERQAIDWIGDRYDSGYTLYRLLWVESNQSEDDEWDGPNPIVFHVPEHVAWEIAEIRDEQGWPCFGAELSAKLDTFCDRIV